MWITLRTPCLVTVGVHGAARLPVPAVQARILLAGAPLISKGLGVGAGSAPPGHRPARVSLATAPRMVAVHRVAIRPVIVRIVIACTAAAVVSLATEGPVILRMRGAAMVARHAAIACTVTARFGLATDGPVILGGM